MIYAPAVHPHAHVIVAPAEVRDGTIRRHAAVRLDRGKAFALSTGLGTPRLWSYATRPALLGFAKGLESGATLPPEARLQHSYQLARAELVSACNVLIERVVPDATLFGVLLHHGELFLFGVGAGRAYLHRGGRPSRLTPREDDPRGLIGADPFTARTVLEPGDLVMAGSASAFSARAVGRVASVLQDDPQAPPSVIGGLLTEPARKAGVGAAAVVLRVR